VVRIPEIDAGEKLMAKPNNKEKSAKGPADVGKGMRGRPKSPMSGEGGEIRFVNRIVVFIFNVKFIIS